MSEPGAASMRPARAAPRPQTKRLRCYRTNMDKIRFGQIRAARRVLDLKERVVAGILQMPHDELREGERLDSVIPSAHAELARQLIRLAERVRKSPGPRVIGQTRRGVLLPFERPHCLDCRYPLNVTVTAIFGPSRRLLVFQVSEMWPALLVQRTGEPMP